MVEAAEFHPRLPDQNGQNQSGKLGAESFRARRSSMRMLGEGDGPFGSHWRSSTWLYGIFLLVIVAGSASGPVGRNPFLYGVVFWAVTIALVV